MPCCQTGHWQLQRSCRSSKERWPCLCAIPSLPLLKHFCNKRSESGKTTFLPRVLAGLTIIPLSLPGLDLGKTGSGRQECCIYGMGWLALVIRCCCTRHFGKSKVFQWCRSLIQDRRSHSKKSNQGKVRCGHQQQSEVQCRSCSQQKPRGGKQRKQSESTGLKTCDNWRAQSWLAISRSKKEWQTLLQ